MPDLTIHNYHAPLLVDASQAPKPADFGPRQRVKFRPGVTGGMLPAEIIESRYSPFFGSWLYDIKITGDRSAVYAKGSMHFSIAESQLRRRFL